MRISDWSSDVCSSDLNISVHKVGTNMDHRILRVEGEDGGHTGYWEKDYQDMNPDDWRFTRTDRPLRGTLLDNRPYDSSLDDAGPSEDASFTRNMDQLATLAAHAQVIGEIGRASCRERVCQYV